MLSTTLLLGFRCAPPRLYAEVRFAGSRSLPICSAFGLASLSACIRVNLWLNFVGTIQSYYYFPSSVPLFHDPNSIGSITQAVAPIDDRFQFPAHDEFA